MLLLKRTLGEVSLGWSFIISPSLCLTSKWKLYRQYLFSDIFLYIFFSLTVTGAILCRYVSSCLISLSVKSITQSYGRAASAFHLPSPCCKAVLSVCVGLAQCSPCIRTLYAFFLENHAQVSSFCLDLLLLFSLESFPRKVANFPDVFLPAKHFTTFPL